MILTLIIILSCTYMSSVSFLSLELSKHLFDSITSYVNHAWQVGSTTALPMYAGKTSASWSKYNIQKKNTHTKRPLKGWEPEFKGTRGEAYTTSSPPPYLCLGPTHMI